MTTLRVIGFYNICLLAALDLIYLSSNSIYFLNGVWCKTNIACKHSLVGTKGWSERWQTNDQNFEMRHLKQNLLNAREHDRNTHTKFSVATQNNTESIDNGHRQCISNCCSWTDQHKYSNNIQHNGYFSCIISFNVNNNKKNNL